jgi:WD40 repeat protein
MHSITPAEGLWELDPLKLAKKSTNTVGSSRSSQHQQPLAVLIGHTGWVRTVDYAPTGLLASGSGDCTIRLWAAESVRS